MDSILTEYSREHDLELVWLFVLYLIHNLFFSTNAGSMQVGYIEIDRFGF